MLHCNTGAPLKCVFSETLSALFGALFHLRYFSVLSRTFTADDAAVPPKSGLHCKDCRSPAEIRSSLQKLPQPRRNPVFIAKTAAVPPKSGLQSIPSLRTPFKTEKRRSRYKLPRRAVFRPLPDTHRFPGEYPDRGHHKQKVYGCRDFCGCFRDFHPRGHQPLTAPAETPPTMFLDRTRYTMMTGKIENAIIA